MARVPALVFHILLLALTLAVMPARMNGEYESHSVIGVIIRDGIWAFFIILGESRVKPASAGVEAYD